MQELSSLHSTSVYHHLLKHIDTFGSLLCHLYVAVVVSACFLRWHMRSREQGILCNKCAACKDNKCYYLNSLEGLLNLYIQKVSASAKELGISELCFSLVSMYVYCPTSITPRSADSFVHTTFCQTLTLLVTFNMYTVQISYPVWIFLGSNTFR